MGVWRTDIAFGMSVLGGVLVTQNLVFVEPFRFFAHMGRTKAAEYMRDIGAALHILSCCVRT